MAIEILENSLQPVINFLNSHPHYSGLLAFFVVFCEALAVVGVIIPGSITMTALGILIGYGVIPAASTFIWAVIGAISGDYVSYIIGVYYKNRLRRIWPFNKYPKLLSHGEKFFHAHGGKSIIIGRFVGPMRAMLPTIAGMLKMPQGRFLLAAIPSASLWAVLYILPGVILGAFAVQLPAKIATKFLFWIMLAVVCIWFISWLTHHFFKGLYRFIDKQVKKWWARLKKRSMWHWLPEFLKDPRNPDNHQQLTRLILALFFSALFIIVIIFTLNNGPFTAWNEPIFYLLQSIRTDIGDHVMLLITFISDKKVIILTQLIFLTYLVTKRYWHTVIHALAILGLSYTILQTTKFLIHIPRPTGLLTFAHDFSFPSGHTMSSIAIYGFLASIIVTELKEQKMRRIPYFLVGIISFFVGLSRLYLGAHWFIDVIGGAILGLAILFLVTLSYRRRHAQTKPLVTSIVAITILGIVLSFYGIKTLQKELIRYSPYLPSQTISLNAWRFRYKQNNELNSISPLYRLNRLGKPINAFNIEWLGNLNEIEKKLIKHGWEKHYSHLNLEKIIHRLATKESLKKLPILPQLYNNRREVLLFTKNIKKNKTLIFRLWDSNIEIQDSDKQLWLGVIEFYNSTKKNLNFKKKHVKPKFESATKTVLPYLKHLNCDIHAIKYPKNKQPKIMEDLNWDGIVLLIENKD